MDVLLLLLLLFITIYLLFIYLFIYLFIFGNIMRGCFGVFRKKRNLGKQLVEVQTCRVQWKI